MIKELLSDVKKYCDNANVNFDKIKDELQEFIDKDEIIDYYISVGPPPRDANMLLDIYIISKTMYYNYEIRKEGNFKHLLPIKNIVGITERMEDGFLTVHINSITLTMRLYAFEKIKMAHNLRKFFKILQDIMLEKLKRGE